MKYKINEITPKEMYCAFGGCPSIYEGLKELTPKEMCIVGSCPSIYDARMDGDKVYLIIGKKVKPSEVGLGELENKIGTEEVLIEVPRNLIDNKGE